MAMAREAPGSLESLRARNRARALAVLQQRGAASQADIVRATGLSRTTVSSLVAELLEDGIVVERTTRRGRRHRPRAAAGHAVEPGAVVGRLRRDRFRARSGPGRDRRPRRRVAVDGRPGDRGRHHADEALAAAEQLVSDLLAEAGLEWDRVIGVGVAVSAPVRTDSPQFASGVIFPAWAKINVAEVLSERLGMPVHLGNDANLGALAEATFGAGRGKRNLFYVMLSEGIGGGVIVDGRIYLGRAGAAGELGHIVVDPDGQVCRCGNRGCLATVAGGAALTAALRQIHGPKR